MKKVPHVVFALDGLALDPALEASLLKIGKLPLSQPNNFSFSILSSHRELSGAPGGIAMYVVFPNSAEERSSLISGADIVLELPFSLKNSPDRSHLLMQALARGQSVVSPELAGQAHPRFFSFSGDTAEPALLKALNGPQTGNSPIAVSQPKLAEPLSTTARPLRLLQILTSYEEAILQLYKAMPALATQPFEHQVEALVQDGFNAAHILAPALRTFGFETGVIIANCRPAQEKWIHEQKVVLPLSRDWIKEIVRQQIAFYQPDVVYTNDPLTFEASFIGSLPFRPRLMVGWRAAPIPGGISWDGYDLMVSNISGCREIMLALGAKSAAPHSPGFPQWLASRLVQQPHQIDVVFAGSLTKGHQRRVEYVDCLARAVIDQANHGRRFSAEFYVGGDPIFIPPAVQSLNRGDLFGRRYFEALRRGRMILDVRGSAIALHDPVSGKHYDMAGSESGSMRLFEATGSCCMLLTDHHEGLSKYFEVGKEIVSFTDERDLVEKIAYYAAHPHECEAIARRGHERCMRDYSVEKSAERFGLLVRACLENREFPGLVRRI